jgi:hypothetical protein
MNVTSNITNKLVLGGHHTTDQNCRGRISDAKTQRHGVGMISSFLILYTGTIDKVSLLHPDITIERLLVTCHIPFRDS